ncbi:hypothetical protein BC829DRAFT_384841 [Chytridium lagenaria]|nr:hypothetical protein BC829DRAFT_384841 [Chytridium lagenaria]
MESIQQNQLQRGAGIEEGSPYRHSAMTDNFRGLEMARFDGDPSLQQLLWTNGHVGNVATSPPVAAGHLRTRPSIDTMSTSMVSQSYHVSPTTVTASHGSSIVSDASGSGGSSEILGSNSEGQGVWRSNSGSGLASVPEEDDDSSGSGSQAVRAHSGPRLNSRGARPRMDAPGIYTRSCHLPFYTHPGQTQQQPNPSTSGSSILASPAAPGYTGSYASDAYYQQMWANGYTYDPATTWQQNYVQSAGCGSAEGEGEDVGAALVETTPPGTMGKEGVEGGFLTADVKRMVEEGWRKRL